VTVSVNEQLSPEQGAPAPSMPCGGRRSRPCALRLPIDGAPVGADERGRSSHAPAPLFTGVLRRGLLRSPHSPGPTPVSVPDSNLLRWSIISTPP
jgi:hypothetical protein